MPGQTKLAEESNEITAIPELLQVLDIAACIETVDALNCQQTIAEAIIDKE